MKLLISKAWEMYKADKRIEGFSPQTLRKRNQELIDGNSPLMAIKMDIISSAR